MEYFCICGKRFKHQPSLSRHQRGNEKLKIKSCDEYANFSKMKKEEARKAFLACRNISEETSMPIHIHNHDPSMIPDFVNMESLPPLLPDIELPFEKRVMNARPYRVQVDMRRVVVSWLNTIYMNPEHPEYWNVILQNVTTMEVKVRRDGTWVIEPFKSWAMLFSKLIIKAYLKYTDNQEDHNKLLGYMLMQLDECWKEIFEALKKEMSNEYMRMRIKEHAK